MRQPRGFTLIELMITIAVLGIIMAVAIPAYTEQMRKSRRAEAFQGIGDLQLKLEKWRSNNATYSTNAATIGGSASSPSGYYNFTIASAAPAGSTGCGATALSNANSYRITATAAGAQAGDTKCATIYLTNACGTIQKESTGGGDCW